MDRSTEGFTTAEFLLDRGCEIELLIPHPFAQFSAEQITYGFALGRIHRKGGKMTLALEISSVDDGRVVLSGVFGGPSEVREGIDTVVVSRGSRANAPPWKEE
jgi:hypothetical protein